MSGTLAVRWGRTVAGLLSLALVPTLMAAVVVVPIAMLTGAGRWSAIVGAAVIGIGTATLFGPMLIARRLDRLPNAALDDRPASYIEDRVHQIATELGIEAPTVHAVRADAANVAVTHGYRGAHLVVSTRLLGLPKQDRDAAIRHALVRLKSRDAVATTALLAPLVVVETLALLATLLIGRQPDRSGTDRRVNRIHGYEPEADRIPPAAYTAAGMLLWLIIVPVWIPSMLADRLYIAEQRRAADIAVARTGPAERDGLANAISFARDAAGAADWPPLFDRLSLVPMADAETGRVRGADRQETRVRLARLRSKRSL